jgi:Kdo2-lipid IVA lauroyltransferase/acyltransferase
MRPDLYRAIRLPVGRAKRIFSFVLGWVTVALLRAVRCIDRKRVANWNARLLRKVGPWLKEHRVGRSNLAAAFPDKSAEEIEQILGGVWDNLGRVAAEFSHLDRLSLRDPKQSGPADVNFDDIAVERFEEIRRGERPTLLFASHLANWELPALIAFRFGLDVCVLFRPPNVPAVADAIFKIREGAMPTLVPSSFGAPLQLARALDRGSHVGILIDQHDQRGVDVTFFGRVCKANPLLAQLARHTGCPVRGARIIRQPDGNSFWGEVTEPLDLPRGADGLPDIAGTMQAATSVIEGWVRERPEQWLWLHRRWR